MLAASQLASPGGMLAPGWLAIRDGVITEVGRGRPPAGVGRHAAIDLGERCLAAGFVDVHVHGGDGVEVNADRPEQAEQAVRRFAAFHAAHGTTSLVATTVSDTFDRLAVALRGVGAATTPLEVPTGADVLGTHLEGPFISPRRAGAQDPGTIAPASGAELDRMIELAGTAPLMVTVAPELPGAAGLIAAARRAGAVVAVGHTDASYEQACAAFDAGASHATHLFNAMAPIHHRAPGPAIAALLDERVTVELIADGHHLHDAMLRLALRLAPRRVALVTDAICAAGWPDGRYPLAGSEVTVRAGRVALSGAPGTLAGSVLTMDAAVRRLVGEGGASLHEALAAASATPAGAVRAGHKGALVAGRDADLVVLDDELEVVATVVRGRAVHDPSGVLAVAGGEAGASA